MKQAPHDIVRAVRQELAWPGRYHLHVTRGEQRSWLQIAFQWIWDRWLELERAIATHIHVGPTGATLLGDGLILAAVVIFGYVAARLLMSIQAEHLQAVEAYEIGSQRSAHLLARAAADAAQAGDYARAIRLLFAAAVTLLDLRGVVRDDASATINELRRALRERSADADGPFLTIARVYTAAAYAEERIDENAWNGAQSAYAALSAAVSDRA